jgi:hypothetical protein
MGATSPSNQQLGASSDEKELINFLIEHKAEVGDSATFKPAVWNTASVLLEKSCVKGGPKTSKACSDKWTRVHRTALDDGTIVDTPTLFIYFSSGRSTTQFPQSRHLAYPDPMKKASM